ncbi:MAG: Qat anti-phage system QueC-like protein QatC [Thermodesulfobacteriota bacterium]|nr:Qat anti-phage system QueC-like protein QatC [Thermodesulfobacteriota bacterium]
MIPRRRASDNWTRDLEVELPVLNKNRWDQVKERLESSLSFLTGDRWRFRFSELGTTFIRPTRRRRHREGDQYFEADIVCLFSGGLDSLVGAIDWLETNETGKIILVGHHDGHVKGPLSDQKALLRILKEYYGDRIDSVLVRIGMNPSGREITFRSRSLLFIAMGLFVAQSMSGRTELLMPENGTIALNVPLTPSRRGTCSTRTAHPFFIEEISGILREIGLGSTIINPLQYKTKGESVEQCAGQRILHSTALESVSCAKRGHNRTWLERSARGCGRCLPCIYRRAALHRVGLDTEIYGRDICSGQVSIDGSDVLGEDFRACMSFLKKNLTEDEIETLILASGNIKLTDLPGYVGLVTRSREEIRVLIRDKGIEAIKRRSGICGN